MKSAQQNWLLRVVSTVALVATVFLSASGPAQAQSRDWWGWGRNQQRRDRDYDRDRDRDRDYDRDRGYGRNGGYGNNRGYYSRDEEKGYRDGLDRGMEDYRNRRRADPNNSSHYRNGNSPYRAGFRRGYSEGYRQYRGSRW